MSSSQSSALEQRFELTKRDSTVRKEIVAGLTTFLAMVYSVIVVPNMLSAAGFPAESVFIATCLVAGLGSILIGFWANAPMAIGCAISLTAFTAFSLVIGQKVSIPVAFGIGLFLLLIAPNGEGLVVGNQNGLPVKLDNFTAFPVMMSLIGLALIIGLEKRKVKGGILWVIIAITIIGLIFDPNVTFDGKIFKMPSFGDESLFLKLDVLGALQPAILPVVFALVMTAVFDATGTIRAVAGQAGLLDKSGQIINGGKALTSDSISSLFSGIFGTAPAAVYIESAAGTAAGGKTGITAIVVGVLFLLMLFFQPLAFLVPNYATAPALMYVGLLMLSNVSKLNFDDIVGAMSGLICAVFIVLTANIVTGIMLGFATLVIGRIVSGDVKRLNVGTVVIAVVLVAFYACGWAI